MIKKHMTRNSKNPLCWLTVANLVLGYRLDLITVFAGSILDKRSDNQLLQKQSRRPRLRTTKEKYIYLGKIDQDVEDDNFVLACQDQLGPDVYGGTLSQNKYSSFLLDYCADSPYKGLNCPNNGLFNTLEFDIQLLFIKGTCPKDRVHQVQCLHHLISSEADFYYKGKLKELCEASLSLMKSSGMVDYPAKQIKSEITFEITGTTAGSSSERIPSSKTKKGNNLQMNSEAELVQLRTVDKKPKKSKKRQTNKNTVMSTPKVSVQKTIIYETAAEPPFAARSSNATSDSSVTNTTISPTVTPSGWPFYSPVATTLPPSPSPIRPPTNQPSHPPITTKPATDPPLPPPTLPHTMGPSNSLTPSDIASTQNPSLPLTFANGLASTQAPSLSQTFANNEVLKPFSGPLGKKAVNSTKTIQPELNINHSTNMTKMKIESATTAQTAAVALASAGLLFIFVTRTAKQCQADGRRDRVQIFDSSLECDVTISSDNTKTFKIGSGKNNRKKGHGFDRKTRKLSMKNSFQNIFGRKHAREEVQYKMPSKAYNDKPDFSHLKSPPHIQSKSYDMWTNHRKHDIKSTDMAHGRKKWSLLKKLNSRIQTKSTLAAAPQDDIEIAIARGAAAAASSENPYGLWDSLEGPRRQLYGMLGLEENTTHTKEDPLKPYNHDKRKNLSHETIRVAISGSQEQNNEGIGTGIMETSEKREHFSRDAWRLSQNCPFYEGNASPADQTITETPLTAVTVERTSQSSSSVLDSSGKDTAMAYGISEIPSDPRTNNIKKNHSWTDGMDDACREKEEQCNTVLSKRCQTFEEPSKNSPCKQLSCIDLASPLKSDRHGENISSGGLYFLNADMKSRFESFDMLLTNAIDDVKQGMHDDEINCRISTESRAKISSKSAYSDDDSDYSSRNIGMSYEFEGIRNHERELSEELANVRFIPARSSPKSPVLAIDDGEMFSLEGDIEESFHFDEVRNRLRVRLFETHSYHNEVCDVGEVSLANKIDYDENDSVSDISTRDFLAEQRVAYELQGTSNHKILTGMVDQINDDVGSDIISIEQDMVGQDKRSQEYRNHTIGISLANQLKLISGRESPGISSDRASHASERTLSLLPPMPSYSSAASSTTASIVDILEIK